MDCRGEFFKVPSRNYRKLPQHDTPTDRDFQRALRMKNDIDQDIYFLECQVDWLQSALEDAQHTLGELLPDREKYARIISKTLSFEAPATFSTKKVSARNDVPAELWFVIFQEVLKSTEATETLSTLQTLSLVCKSWKYITDNSPGLWTRFQPRAYKNHDGASPNAVATALRRSKGIPLDLTLDQEDYDDIYMGVLTAVFPQTAQLHLEISDDDDSPLESMLGPLLMQFSRLRRLSLRRYLISERYVLPGKYLALSPLTSLCLDNVPVETHSMPTLLSVRHLSLRVYEASIMDRFLRRCPNVVTLQVSITHAEPVVPGPRAVGTHICHSLRELTVVISVTDRCWAVLGVLHAPTLQKLKFEFCTTTLPIYRDRAYDDLITQFLVRSSNSLVSLSLEDNYCTLLEEDEPPACTSWSDKIAVILNAAPLMLNLNALQITVLDCHTLPVFIKKMVSVSPDLIILPHLTQFTLAVLEEQVQDAVEMLRSRALSNDISSMKVIDLRVYNLFEDEEDDEETSEMDSPNTIASLEEWRRNGATVSCYAYPRFTNSYGQE